MKICDKCGNKLPNELSNTEYPQYAVMERLNPNFFNAVDLCNDCMKKLYKWLRTTEGEEALEQEPKTGHWIGIDEEPHTEYKYCPNCGARMLGL